MRTKASIVVAVLLVVSVILFALIAKIGNRDSPDGTGANAMRLPTARFENPGSSPIEKSVGADVRKKFTYDIPAPANDEQFLISMRTAMGEPNEHRKEKALLDLFEYLTPKNAESILGLFAEFDKIGVRQDFAWHAFWARWGEIDGAGAMRYSQNDSDESRQRWIYSPLMEGWAATDPSAAREWLNASRGVKYFEAALASYASQVAQADLSAATRDVFAASGDKGTVFWAVSALANAASSRGVNGVATWFSSLSPAEKAIAFEHAQWHINDAPVGEAAEWFRQQAGEPWRDDKHLALLANKFVEKDPAAALAWLTALPVSPQSHEQAGLLPALETWTRLDETAAAHWLDGRESQPWFADAAAGHFLGLARRDNKAAQTFLGQFDSDSQQMIVQSLCKRR